MFAARNDRGGLQVDFRVNGQDWDAGGRPLEAYAEAWPQAGLQWRKQYIIMQTRERGVA